jgi:hypothetical protein
MGTTESLPDETRAAAPSDSHPPSEEHQVGHGTQSPPRIARNPPPLPPPSGSPSQRHAPVPYHPSQPNSSPNRRRPPPKPVLRLEGVLVGGPETGKRTLLQRLQGKDPFRNDTSDESNSVSTTIPYKPPPKSLAPDRVLLHIQCLQNSNQVEAFHQNHQAHFVVVLVNPKHTLETTRSYLQRLLNLYLDSLGYPVSNTDQQEDGDDGKKVPNTDNLASNDHEPLCVCILFNFRDLLKENSTLKRQLERNVTELLQQRSVPQHKVVMDWIHVSLKNCYGLDLLHAFIYKAYLSRKETILERQLHAIQTQRIVICTQEKENGTTSYEEFLKGLAPTKEERKQQPSQKDQPAHAKVATTGQEDSSDESSVDSRRRHRQRRTFPSSLHPKNGKKSTKQLSFGTGREALEAFLASSDEEEEETPKKGQVGKTTSSSSDEDDDDDDDFFYDERGQRRFNHPQHQHHTIHASTSSDSKTEERNGDAPQSTGSNTPSTPECKDNPDSDNDDNNSFNEADPNTSFDEESNSQSHGVIITAAAANVEVEEVKKEDNTVDTSSTPVTINHSNEVSQSGILPDDCNDKELGSAITPESNVKSGDDDAEINRKDSETRSDHSGINETKDSDDDDHPALTLDPTMEHVDNKIVLKNFLSSPVKGEDSDDDGGYLIASPPHDDQDEDNDSGDYVIGQANRTAGPEEEDSDDDEDYVIDSLTKTGAVNSVGNVDFDRNDELNDDNDNDDQSQNIGSVEQPLQGDSEEDDGTKTAPGQSFDEPSNEILVNESKSSSALSEAALAAVEAAQREAELMLLQQQQSSQEGISEKKRAKEKKSKKKKEGKPNEKKKKKKKKEKEDD